MTMVPPVDGDVLEIVGNAFDRDWYLAAYPEVAGFAGGPVIHYLLHGVEEGHDPTPDFDTSFYLEDNPDIASLNVNPFYHYLTAGKNERRHPTQPGGSTTLRIYQIRPPKEKSLLWRTADADRLLTVRELRAAAEDTITDKLYLSFSHDIYLNNVGGVQQCIAREEQAARGKGAVYLNLSPHQPLPMLSENKGKRSEKPFIFNLALNGRFLGKANPSTLKETLAGLECNTVAIYHALHGHSPEIIMRILEGLQVSSTILWTHDYFTLCVNHNLLRNGVKFCGAPRSDSKACQICIFGDQRLEHVARIERLFRIYRPYVVSPSIAALEIWKEKVSFDYKDAEVVEHIKLVPKATRRKEHKRGQQPRRLRIAYLGFPDAHKGGPDFRDLHRHFIHDDRYEFIHLGGKHEQLSELPMDFTKVQCSPENPTAMIDAVKNHEIDVVFLASCWPETFNLICYEAVAAGAKIICYESSGNVADFVSANDHGVVVSSYEEAMGLFKSGFDLRTESKQYYDIEYSTMAVGSKGDSL